MRVWGELRDCESNTEMVSEGKGNKVCFVCLFDGLRETCRDLVQLNAGPR